MNERTDRGPRLWDFKAYKRCRQNQTPACSSGILRSPAKPRLSKRAKAGDADAFSKLYSLHKRRVYTLCLRMLGNVSEAEDMTQEAFLHLFRKLGASAASRRFPPGCIG